jgi:hypothetical protein
VISAQYSLDTNEADVAATRYYLGQVSSPAILIGSSYGGGSSPPRAPMTAPAAWSTSPPSAGRRQDLPETAGQVPKTALLDKIKVRGCNGSFAVLAPSWA